MGNGVTHCLPLEERFDDFRGPRVAGDPVWVCRFLSIPRGTLRGDVGRHPHDFRQANRLEKTGQTGATNGHETAELGCSRVR
jgi:hypothetical protein